MLDALVGTYKADRPTLVSAHGCKVTTEDGRELLDFVSGIGVNALGYGHPVISQAIESAVATGLLHTSNLYRNLPAQKLAQLLTEHSFADKVFFSNSGGEANEAAFKFARRWARTGSAHTDASVDDTASDSAAYDKRLEDELRSLDKD